MGKENIKMDEVGKYHPKKQSNTSKSNKKSKHKHIYKACLFEDYSFERLEPRLYIGTYCSVCGKIGNRTSPTIRYYDEKFGRNVIRMLNYEEIMTSYPDLPEFRLDDFFQKCVTLSENINTEDEKDV